jgi:hypothetical protein
MSAWETQELPVLRALAKHFADSAAPPAEVGDIATASGLGEDTVVEVLGVLSASRPPYVEGYALGAMEGAPRVTALTDRARRELERDEVAGHLARHEPVGSWRPETMSGGTV